MTEEERKSGSTRWWGEHELEGGQVLRCRVGPLELSVQRLPREWRIARRHHRGAEAESAPAEVSVGAETLSEADAVERFLVRATGDACRLSPALADRPVVSRPEVVFHVPPGESTTLFVSSPVWVRVAEGSARDPLLEVPAIVASDTWFGASTREGELCYASRTSGRLDLDDVPLRPHRAVTPVSIENRGADRLTVDRLSLPVPYLSVFCGPRGFLWTEAVTFVREEDGGRARLHVQHGASAPARGGELLAEPRRERAEAGLFQAFSTLFA